MNTKKISVFIPIFNEEANIYELYSQLDRVLVDLNLEYEIIFIDDHSTDASYKILKEISHKDKNVKVIHFKKNYGQTAAMQAGFMNSKGDIVISMDGDLQNDPADIPELIEKINEGYDLVCGWRKKRKDKFFSRRLPSLIANKLISKITGLKLHDYGCTLKAYKSEIVKTMSLYGDMHRFIPVYAFWEGASITELVVNHRERNAGKSKYGMSRVYKVILDLLTINFLSNYSTKPNYLFGGIGLSLCSISMAITIIPVVKKILYGTFIHRDPLILLSVMCFLIGVLFVLIGLLAEILVRIYHESQSKPIFNIKEKINF